MHRPRPQARIATTPLVQGLLDAGCTCAIQLILHVCAAELTVGPYLGLLV